MRFALSSNCCLGRFLSTFLPLSGRKLGKDFSSAAVTVCPLPNAYTFLLRDRPACANCPAVFCFIVPLYFAKIERMYCNGKEI